MVLDKKKNLRRRIFRPSARRLVQLYSALLHNAYLKGFISGEIYKGQSKAVCIPGLNCYSCPGAVGACPLGSLQNALASAGHRTGWYVFGILILFGVMLGRTVCGWLCPLGLVQELLHKIPVPKIRRSRFTRVLSCMSSCLRFRCGTVSGTVCRFRPSASISALPELRKLRSSCFRILPTFPGTVCWASCSPGSS